jgi:hypothetical protein
MNMTETNQITAVANDDRTTEFETRRKQQIAAQAKTLAHKLDRARFKTAWLTLGQVASLNKSPNV